MTQGHCFSSSSSRARHRTPPPPHAAAAATRRRSPRRLRRCSLHVACRTPPSSPLPPPPPPPHADARRHSSPSLPRRRHCCRPRRAAAIAAALAAPPSPRRLRRCSLHVACRTPPSSPLPAQRRLLQPLPSPPHLPIAQPSSIKAVSRSCGIRTMMTVRNYSTAGATPVVVQLTNIGEQAPLLLLKAWINRHTRDMPGCLSCRARMCFSLFVCISQVTSVYVGSLIGLVHGKLRLRN